MAKEPWQFLSIVNRYTTFYLIIVFLSKSYQTFSASLSATSSQTKEETKEKNMLFGRFWYLAILMLVCLFASIIPSSIIPYNRHRRYLLTRTQECKIKRLVTVHINDKWFRGNFNPINHYINFLDRVFMERFLDFLIPQCSMNDDYRSSINYYFYRNILFLSLARNCCKFSHWRGFSTTRWALITALIALQLHLNTEGKLAHGDHIDVGRSMRFTRMIGSTAWLCFTFRIDITNEDTPRRDRAALSIWLNC